MADILIVDDEAGARRLLMRCTDGLGHQIFEADSADAALKVMAHRLTAVVFCDIQMPGQDGLWLTMELRKRYPTTAIILATSVQTVPPRFSLQAGVLAYLVKPFQRPFVANAVAAALKWHDEAVSAGPVTEDSGDWVPQWLDSLDRNWG